MNNNVDFKKKLKDEIRYIKDLLDSKENELAIVEKEDIKTVEDLVNAQKGLAKLRISEVENYQDKLVGILKDRCNCLCCCDNPKFEWEDEEDRSYSEYDDEIEPIPNFRISIEVDCENKNFKNLLKEIISEKVDEVLEEIFNDDEDDSDDKTELKFIPIYDEYEGKVMGVMMTGICPYCCDEHKLQIFTDGSYESEKMAEINGLREDNDNSIDEDDILEYTISLEDRIFSLEETIRKQDFATKSYVEKSVEDLKYKIPQIVASNRLNSVTRLGFNFI